MNSKGIEPRVGMQVVFRSREMFGFREMSLPKKISKISDVVRFDDRQYCWLPGEGGDWDHGKYEIEWIPPTDEERVMFANLAKNALDFGVTFSDVGMEFCNREGVEFDDFARIAESLALDGMDIDDVSKIEELMR